MNSSEAQIHVRRPSNSVIAELEVVTLTFNDKLARTSSMYHVELNMFYNYYHNIVLMVLYAAICNYNKTDI